MLPVIPVGEIAGVTFRLVGKAANTVSEFTLPAKVLKAFKALTEVEQAAVLKSVGEASNTAQVVDAIGVWGPRPRST